MSTYFQAWGSTLSTCPDPSTSTPEQLAIVGHFANYKPIEQGVERVRLVWNALTPAEYKDLFDTWNTNKDSSGTFDIPDRSGTAPEDYRSVVAYAQRPLGQFGQRIRSQVTMLITITG